MRKLCAILSLWIVASALPVVAGNVFEFKAGMSHVRLEFYTPQIVRITKTPDGVMQKEAESEVVTMKPQEGLSVGLTETQQKAVMRTTELTVTLDKRTALVTFTSGGKTLLREKETAFDVRQTGSDKGRYEVTMTYTLDKNETIYGLGTVQDGRLSRRGLTKTVEQSNLEDFQNVIQSIKGWGIYWDNRNF